MFENIPSVLRAIPHWVAANEDKQPINPRTGRFADPSDPATGGTFEEAIHCGKRHIGFILSELDPYTIIDLDDPFERVVNKVRSKIFPHDPDYGDALKRAERHQLIYENFPTYAELSQSRNGVHLVMEGVIPAAINNRKRKIEIYCKERYIIFTGNVLKNAPVVNCQEQIDWVYREIGRLVDDSGELVEEEQTKEDSDIWRIATNASNAARFVQLCEGDWQNMKAANGEPCFPSQSEADFSLMSMLAFYTRSNEQAVRMFRQTALGRRAKADRDEYFTGRYGILKKIRSREIPPVDLSKLTPITVAPEPPPPPVVATSAPSGYTFPPGLVGEVAEYILATSYRPLPESALAAAIALCAGICGRYYNISNYGLNQYVILLGRTGRGKEGAASGINRLIASIRNQIPMISEFMGPSAFASGQSIVKTLNKKKCFVSVLGEFGITLKNICDSRASEHQTMIKKVLLDVYGKSGHSEMLYPSVYSDSEKNTQIVQAPNITILGETNPVRFFEGLDSSHILEGLIPRFLVIEYKGDRPPPNKNAFSPPPDRLIQQFGQLVTQSVTMDQNNTCCPVSENAEATAVFDRENAYADELMNASNAEDENELYNRYHLKILKIAALIAVGVNPLNPVVTGEIAEWATALVRKETTELLAHFKSDDMGTGEARHEAEIRRLTEVFQTMSKSQREAQRCPKELMEFKVVTRQFLVVYTRRLGCFKNDKRGALRALNEALGDMINREILEVVNGAQYGVQSAIYQPGPGWG